MVKNIFESKEQLCLSFLLDQDYGNLPSMEIAKLIIEIINTIVGIALLIIAFYGLGQIKQAKKSLRTQSLRDTRKMTADYTYLYLDRIIKKRSVIEVAKEDVAILKSFHFSSKSEGIDKEKILLSNAKIKLNTDKQIKDYIDKLTIAYKPFGSILNELEAFCAAISSGVLDEALLYRSVGKNFIGLIQDNYLQEWLHYLSSEKGLYTNLTEIYDLWELRRLIDELEKVEKMNDSATDQIDELKKKLRVTERHTIDRIGVDD